MQINLPQIPVFKLQVKNHVLTKKLILDAIDSMGIHSFDDLENKLSNTDWFLPTNFNRPYWELFHNDAIRHIDELRKYYEYKKVTIRNYWFQQYKRGDFHSKHTHSDASFSNIYYAELANEKAVTSFYYCGKEYKIEVEEGDILSFPGLLIHESKPLDSDERKTVIVFNTNVD